MPTRWNISLRRTDIPAKFSCHGEFHAQVALDNSPEIGKQDLGEVIYQCYFE
jgi:hypothetical protein